MSNISIEEVKHVAHLARLAVTEEEAENFREQLNKIITYAEMLNTLPTDGVAPTTHVLQLQNVMREDVVGNPLPIEEVVKNAPDHQNGYIVVPAIIE
ncbi:MAG: Asp-tRNA(Asn)/Glu-tRNA(Gln) amidotransferase subunit GatC [Bacilli bacterium]